MESVFSSADLLAMIIARLYAARDRARCRLVCKGWCRVISSERVPLLWGGAPDYASFRWAARTLPYSFDRLGLVRHLSATEIWNIHAFLPQSTVTRYFGRTDLLYDIHAALTTGILKETDLKDPIVTKRIGTLFKYDRVIVALYERIVTVADVLSLSDFQLWVVLVTGDAGLAILRAKLLTPDQLRNIPGCFHMRHLFESPQFASALTAGETIVSGIVSEGAHMTFCWDPGFTNIQFSSHPIPAAARSVRGTNYKYKRRRKRKKN